MARTDWGIGIIGLGGISHMHLEGYRRQGLRVVGGMDIDPERGRAVQEKFRFPVLEDEAEALIARPDVRVVDLAVPHAMAIRRPLVETAARHGKALFVQKPLQARIGDATILVEIAERAGVPLMVNQNSIFSPQALALEPFLRRGEGGEPAPGWIGEPYYFQIENRAWFAPGLETWVAKSERWVNSDMAIHHYALIRHWFGDAESVAAVMKRDRSQAGARGETVCSVLVRFKNGVEGLVLNNWSYRGPRHRPHSSEEIVIQGDRGSITADAREVTSFGVDGDHRVAVEGTWFPDAFGRSMAHYIDALDAGLPFLCSGRDNLRSLAIMEAGYRSTADRREVRIDDVLSEAGAGV